VPLQQSLKQLEVAYKNYFDSLKGKRKGKKGSNYRWDAGLAVAKSSEITEVALIP
jgi:transposase